MHQLALGIPQETLGSNEPNYTPGLTNRAMQNLLLPWRQYLLLLLDLVEDDFKMWKPKTFVHSPEFVHWTTPPCIPWTYCELNDKHTVPWQISQALPVVVTDSEVWTTQFSSSCGWSTGMLMQGKWKWVKEMEQDSWTSRVMYVIKLICPVRTSVGQRRTGQMEHQSKCCGMQQQNKHLTGSVCCLHQFVYHMICWCKGKT